jgi:hypothetical protein
MRPQIRLTIALAESEENGDFGGMVVAGIDGTTGRLLPPVPQFHVFNRTTDKYDVFLHDQIAGLELPEGTYGKRGERKTRLIAPSKEEHDALFNEIQNTGIEIKPGPPFQLPAEGTESQDGTMPVTIEGVIDDSIKRAMVKILINFVAKYLGLAEIQVDKWAGAIRFVRLGDGTIRMRVSEKPFWTGQETDRRRFADDSVNIRIENQSGHVVGVIQFYNLFTYEFILVENYSVLPAMELGYRFTPGNEPILGGRGRT